MPGVFNARYEGHSRQAGSHRETGRKLSTETDQFRQSLGGHWWVAALREIRKYGRLSRRVLQRIILTTDCCTVDWFLMVTWMTCEDECHHPSKAQGPATRGWQQWREWEVEPALWSAYGCEKKGINDNLGNLGLGDWKPGVASSVRSRFGWGGLIESSKSSDWDMFS